MKTHLIKYALLSCLMIITSCSKQNTLNSNETISSKVVTVLKNDLHQVKVSSKSGTLSTGYNLIELEFTDLSGNSISVSEVSWFPMMTMNMNGHQHTHSCPFSGLTKQSKTYQGHIIFTMPTSDTGSWKLTIHYVFQGKLNSIEGDINVSALATNIKNVSSKNGYVLGLVQPQNPKMGSNDMIVALYKMNMEKHLYETVSNYTIEIDPRMPDPSMGNHGSSNNTPLVQQPDGLYRGKVNFTMSGHWRINLQLKDENKNVVLGESVSESTPNSSIYFDLEF